MVQVMFYLGYFVMAIPAGIIIDRRGYRTGVIVGLLLYGFGALLFWPGAQIMSFEFFLMSLFIIACGLVFLETAANPYVTELGDVETLITKLYLCGKLSDEQLRVMKQFGDRRRAPHQYIWAENRAADLWRRAMQTIGDAAIERGWISQE